MQVIDSATEAAPGSVNEDLAVVGDRWAIVLDGAGRYPGQNAGCVHSVTWIVARLAEHISSGLAEQGDSSLTELVRRAVSATMDDHGPSCNLTDPLSPGAVAALVRIGNLNVEWLVIGDCALVIEQTDGRHIAVIDDRVDHLPGAPVTDAPVRTYTPDFVKTVRNRPGGFWVLGAVPEAADNALTGHLPLSECRAVLLCSDGISRLTERYGWAWADVFSAARKGGVEALIGAVRTAEHGDPDPRRWRGKRHDDATAVIMDV